jgi:hypothetical protein
MSVRACVVTATDSEGVRHSVEVTSRSLYEAAILGFKMLREDGWTETIGNTMKLEIKVRHPAVTHEVSIQQIRRGVDATPKSPEERLRKAELKELLAG